MFRSSVALVLLAAASFGAHAVSVTIITPYINFENDAINSLGFATGQFLRFGALSVSTPNGSAGPTGLATTLVNGSTVSRTINHNASPLLPNFFERRIPIDQTAFNPRTLTFTNGTNSAQTQVQMVPGAQLLPFVNSITLSGTSANPTFTWTPPLGVTVNGYQINIFDKSLVNLNSANGPINTGLVSSSNVAPNATSYTVSADKFTVPGYAFAPNKNYSISISLMQTRDGSSNLGLENIESSSAVYADFTPNFGGGPPVNLPVVLMNGAYQFNIAVQVGQTYYIDPEVAIGYDYAIGLGDPNFQSVLLPVGIGDGLYDIFGFDNLNNLVLLADDWVGGTAFGFGAGGVSRFRVTGIETSAGIDPTNITAFITELTFADAGNFTGTQTPIVQRVQNVPEPGSLSLVGLALAGLFA